jgi:hypothetical protein
VTDRVDAAGAAMTIEYLTDTGRLQVEHVEQCDVHRWAAEHPLAIIVHAVPDRPETG